jgi:potassium-dependent mechanosensitive channel
MIKINWTFLFAATISFIFSIQGLLIYNATRPPKSNSPEQETRADGSKLNPLDVVLITDTSGLTKSIGTDVSKGFQDAINAQQIDKYIRLVVRDDKGQVASTAALADGSAAGFQTLAMIGPTAPAGFDAIRQASKEGNVVSLSPIGNPTQKPNGPWTFSMQADTFLRGQMLGRFLQRAVDGKIISRLVPEGVEPDGLWSGVINSYKDVGSAQLELNPWKLGMSPEELKNAVAKNSYYDAIIISLPTKDAVNVVRQYRLFGYIGKIILEGEASLESFSQNFADDLREKIEPGYYTNDLMSLVPFTTTIGNVNSQVLISEYRRKYNTDPSWAYAYGFDTGTLISSFIKSQRSKNVLNLKNPDGMRADLQKYLKNLNIADEKPSGFTGELAFDNLGQRAIPQSVVIYKNRKQLPYYLQFSTKPSLSANNVGDPNFVSVGEMGYGLIPVVYSGFQIERIDDINFDKGQFSATFDLWLKSKDLVDISDIQFINLIGEMKSQKIIEESTTKVGSFRRYKLSGLFSFSPRPSDVLLDRTNIGINFRHRNSDQDHLKFVIDPDFNTIERSARDIDQNINLGSFNVISSFMATDVQKVSAPGHPKSVNGFINYSLSRYLAQIGKRNSSVTSYLASELGDENLYFTFYMSTSLLISLIIFNLVTTSTNVKILTQLSFASTAILSETALFTSPLIDGFSSDFLPYIRIIFAAFEIFSIIRAFDIGLLVLLNSNEKERQVQPVILFFMRFGLYFTGIAYFYTVTINKDIIAVLATFSVALTVIGLALREIIFDAIAGIAMAGDRHIEVGQWVSLRTRDRTISGIVQGLGWRFVRIKSRDEQTHFVPNSAIATQILSNLSLSDGFTRVDIPFEMSAEIEFDAIRPIILDAIKLKIANSDGVDRNREPRVLLNELHDKTLVGVVQIHYSADRSVDSLRTDVLDAVRQVLNEISGFSDMRAFPLKSPLI